MTNKTYRLTRIGVVAAFVVSGAVACNNSDYKTSDNSPGADSGTRRISTTTVPADSIAIEGSAAAGTMTPAAGTAVPATGTVKAATASPAAEPAPVSSAPTAAVTHPGEKPSTKGKFSRGRVSITMPKVYGSAQVAPRFPGGQNGLDSYINNHVNYPQKAIDDEVSGIVHISFVVDENGKVTKARIVEGNNAGDGLDKEALRIVNAMPVWTPGKVKGKNVRVRMELPISFQVES